MAILSVPAVALAIISVALAAGGRLGPAWGLLAVGFYLGLLAGAHGFAGPIEPALCLIAALAGGVAAALPGWGGLAMPLAAAAGAAAGFVTMADHANLPLPTVAGSAVATLVAYGVAAGAAEELRSRGFAASLGVRIAAAWIAATALLLLALTLRPAVSG